MVGFVVIGVMLVCALVPFALTTFLLRRGQAGWALTLASLVGAVLTILLFASGRPMGIDPVFAMTLAMLGAFPAFLGCMAGGVLGWMLRKRDDARLG
ncbi:UDP-N-acetylmuramate--alanine ligase [Yoonia sp.]|uniref:UDP-N-acetylmuramate--alanine ligase n=1 Tax=Yoonia sp. TaxID=2212373 RepID=UPI002FDA8A49